MTRDNPFDFNDASEPFRCLGDTVGAAVEDAAEIIGNTDNKYTQALAGVRAAQQTFTRITQTVATTPEATSALLYLGEALVKAREIISAAQPKKPGRRSNHEREAYVVLAFEWLQQLRKGAMNRSTAIKAVAACIPSDMFQKRGHHELAPDVQLEAWLDRFGREDHVDERRALANVRAGLFDEFYRTWREPVGRREDGNIEYAANEQSHDYRDMSAGVVIEWLRKGLSASCSALEWVLTHTSNPTK